MVWTVRHPDKRDSHVYYDNCSPFYTIRFAHSGEFQKKLIGEPEYVGGSVDFINFVDPDEVSLIELHTMVKPLGCQGDFHLYFSITEPYFSHSLLPLKEDSEVLGMFFFEKQKIVGVFVDHSGKSHYQNIWLITGKERVGTDDEDDVASNKVVNVQIERHEIEPDSDEVRIIELDINDELSESDCVVSIGADSEHSEFYNDSEGNYDLEEDDADYEKYVDPHIEWAGLSLDKSSPPVTRNATKKLVNKIAPAPHVYKGKRVFNPDVDMAKVEFAIPLCFNSREDVINAIKKHAIDLKKDIKFTLRQDLKIQAKCKHKDCLWSIYVSRSPLDATWTLKTLGDDHDCPSADIVRAANPAWLAATHGDDIRMNPSCSMDDLKLKFERKYGIYFSDWQIYRARDLALSRGDVETQYTLMFKYGEEIRRSNPGSTVKITPRTYANKKLFERFYFCYGGMKDGFLLGCRKLILLDGCHIRTDYGGILLTAMGMDPNNGMYPIAYGIVEKERKESWHLFMELLATDLGIGDDGHLWTVMSDKQKGLIDAVNTWAKGCEHRFCVWHLYYNFRLLHSGLSLKLLLWRAAKATRPADFEKVMGELRLADKKAYEWLAAKEPKQWSKTYFETMNHTDLLVNNLSETQNKVLLKARKLPILEMCEAIRMMNMKRIVKRREAMLKHKCVVCPRIEAILAKNRDLASKYSAMWNGHDEFQVTGPYGTHQWAVNIQERVCSCRRWQLSGIPCAHAIACLQRRSKKAEEYVHDCYKTSTYLKVYNHSLHPLNAQDEWPEAPGVTTILQPPVVQSQPGRPKKHKRKLGDGEKKKEPKTPIVRDGKLSKHGTIIHCSNCQAEGHNKAKCPQLPAKPTVIKKYKKNKNIAKKGTECSQNEEERLIEQELIANVFDTIDHYYEELETSLLEPIKRDTRKGKAPIAEPFKKKGSVDDSELMRRLLENNEKSLHINPSRDNETGPKTFFDRAYVGPQSAANSPLWNLPCKRKEVDKSKLIVMSQPDSITSEGKITNSVKSCSQPSRPPWKPSGLYNKKINSTKTVSVKTCKKFVVVAPTEEDPPI